VRLLDTASGRLIQRYPDYRSLSFAPDGQSFLVQRRDESYCLVDAATGKERFPIVGAPLGWVPKSNLLMARDHSTLRVWDTVSSKKVQELEISTKKKPSIVALKKPSIAHSDMAFAYSESRRVAIMERNAPLIHVFSLETGKELGQLGGISHDLMYRAERQCQNRGQGMGGSTSLLPELSPDGETLVAGIDQNSFGLRDVATGKWSVRFRCDTFLPHHPMFSPSGDLLSLQDARGDSCLVDAATGRVRHRLTWKEGDLFWILTSVNREFAPDGRLLAAAYDADTLVLWETATGRLIRTWPGHGKGKLRQMVFSSDGRRLATVSSDGTALAWDVMGMSPDGELPARKLTRAEAKQAWLDLADADAAKGHRAIWTLVADPAQALPLLREQLHPMRGGNPRRIAQLIADLDSDDFLVRETATRELRKAGEPAQPALQTALKGKPSLELRHRVQGLLDEMDSATPTAESLRALRAVAVLEYVASAEARQLLGVLAEGASQARLTWEAKTALARLRLRSANP
jgi:WD40 repeat protein